MGILGLDNAKFVNYTSMPTSLLMLFLSFLKISGEGGKPQAKTYYLSPQFGGAADCPRKRVGGMLELEQLRAYLTWKEGMTSGVFHEIGRCIHRSARELRWVV